MDVPAPEPDLRRPDVAAAAAKGRGMLFLHVEDDEVRSEDLGMLVGTFLMSGTDPQLEPLATVELGCATTAEIEELAPDLAGRSDVRAILVPLRGPATCILAGDPPPVVWTRLGERLADHEASVRNRNAWFSRGLRDGLGVGRATLERHAREEQAIVGTAPQGDPPSEAFVATWPNQARLRAEVEPEQRYLWLASIAASVRARVESRPPERSVWATSLGCGPRYPLPNGQPARMGVACGIGHSPLISRRFLHFYTAEELHG